MDPDASAGLSRVRRGHGRHRVAAAPRGRAPLHRWGGGPCFRIRPPRASQATPGDFIRADRIPSVQPGFDYAFAETLYACLMLIFVAFFIRRASNSLLLPI